MRILVVFFASSATACAVLCATFSCVQPAILGGPTGPSWCPNGVVYGDAGDMCCPAEASLNQYGVCEDTPAPVEPEWNDLAKRHVDAGHD